MTMRYVAICAGALVAAVALHSNSAQALSMKECSVKFKAAKADGTLNGMKWNDFRKAECGADAAATPAPEPAPAKMAKPAAEPRATPAAAGSAVYPSAVDPKYSSQSAGKARFHTCLDQYHANKANNANGGLTWIHKGDSYYHECNTRLKGKV